MNQSSPARPTDATTYARSSARRSSAGIVAMVLWVLVLATIPVWSHFDLPAWDAKIYLTAVHSVQHGHDPWADGVAIQKAAHRNAPHSPSPQGPFSYVYSPITLPVLQAAGMLPLWLVASVYFLLYIAGVAAELWFGVQAMHPRSTDPGERGFFRFVTPLTIFFPGFLACDTILSGNVVFLFYGAILASAVYAWRKGQWRWFYLAVLLASCFKAPLLSLLAIPILSARRQWLWTALTGTAAVALFAMQPVLWPTYFHNYYEAVMLQFQYNRDFGFSPAGLFSGVLYDHNIPYSPASSIFYLAYAIPLFAILWSFSRRFLRGEFNILDWAPVLLVGVILLNPRLIEYDAAPLALPLALIAWRFIRRFAEGRAALLSFALLFAACNAFALQSWSMWKLTEGPLLVVFFAAGAYTLLNPRRATSSQLQTESEPVLLRA